MLYLFFTCFLAIIFCQSQYTHVSLINQPSSILLNDILTISQINVAQIEQVSKPFLTLHHSIRLIEQHEQIKKIQSIQNKNGDFEIQTFVISQNEIQLAQIKNDGSFKLQAPILYIFNGELKQYNKVILIDQMVIAIASSNDNKLQLLLKMNVKEQITTLNTNIVIPDKLNNIEFFILKYSANTIIVKIQLISQNQIEIYQYDLNLQKIIDKQVFSYNYCLKFWDTNNFTVMMNNNNFIIVQQNIQIVEMQAQENEIYHQFQIKKDSQYSNFIYKIIILSNKKLQILLFNSITGTYIEHNQLQIQQFDEAIAFDFNQDFIFLITNSYISVFNINGQLNLLELKELEQINHGIINTNRNIIVIVKNEKEKSIVTSFKIDYPKLYIERFAYQYNLQKNEAICNIISKETQEQLAQIRILFMDQYFNNQPIPIQDTLTKFQQQIDTPIRVQYKQLFSGSDVSLNQIYSGQQNYQIKFYQKSYYLLTKLEKKYFTICGKYYESLISCSQLNQQILIKDKMIYQNFNQDIIQNCQCIQRDDNLIVIVQFQQNIKIFDLTNDMEQTKSLNNLKFEYNIINFNYLNNLVFVLTQESVLNVFQFNNNEPILSIINQNIQKIYTNYIDYPDLLFFITQDEIQIVQFNLNLKQFYIIQNIPYYQNYRLSYEQSTQFVQLGLLKEGIFILLVINFNNYIQFYPKNEFFIQTEDEIQYFIIELNDYIYTNPIKCSFSSIHFYCLMNNKGSQAIFVLQAANSGYSIRKTYIPFNKQVVINNINTYLTQSQQISENIIIEIQENETKQYQIFQISLGIILIYPQLQPQLEFIYNLKFETNQKQITLQILQLNEHENLKEKQKQNDFNNNKIEFNISQLFYGNVYRLNAKRSISQKVDLLNPIQQTSVFLLPTQIISQATYGDSTYFLTEDNQSQYLYEVKKNSNEPKLLFTFQNECLYLFIERITKYPVAVCYKDKVELLGFNLNLNSMFQYTLKEKNTRELLINYNNGFLQLILKGKAFVAHLYQRYSCYIIAVYNNQFEIENVVYQKEYYVPDLPFFRKYTAPVVITQSNNFTEQPCLIFGVSTFNNEESRSQPTLFLIKACIGNLFSKYFGFNSPFQKTTCQMIKIIKIKDIIFDEQNTQLLKPLIQVGQSIDTQKGYAISLIGIFEYTPKVFQIHIDYNLNYVNTISLCNLRQFYTQSQQTFSLFNIKDMIIGYSYNDTHSNYFMYEKIQEFDNCKVNGQGPNIQILFDEQAKPLNIAADDNTLLVETTYAIKIYQIFQNYTLITDQSNSINLIAKNYNKQAQTKIKIDNIHLTITQASICFISFLFTISKLYKIKLSRQQKQEEQSQIELTQQQALPPIVREPDIVSDPI